MIANSGAKRAFLTHFGEVTNLIEAENQLIEHLDFSEKLLNQSIQSSIPNTELTLFCEKQIYKYFESVLTHRGIEITSPVWDFLKLDLQLNAAGIAHVARKRRNAQNA